MPSVHEPTVRALNPERMADLFVLEFAQGTPTPDLMSRVWSGGQQYKVVGVLDFGDGTGPVVLGLEMEPEGNLPL